MLKRILSGLFVAVFAVFSLQADTTTSRLSLVKPDQSSTGWGTKTNSNWDLVDAAMGCLGCANTFTGVNYFGFVGLRDSNPLSLFNANNTAAVLLSNTGSSGQSQLIVTSLDGMAINNSPLSGIALLVYGENINGLNRGSFAVIGSSADASAAYSGFIGTAPIATSTLWSLPTRDGAAGSFMQTDGAAHLSFNTLPLTLTSGTDPVTLLRLNNTNIGTENTFISWASLGTDQAFLGYTNTAQSGVIAGGLKVLDSNSVERARISTDGDFRLQNSSVPIISIDRFSGLSDPQGYIRYSVNSGTSAVVGWNRTSGSFVIQVSTQTDITRATDRIIIATGTVAYNQFVGENRVSTMTATGYIQLAPKTIAQLKALFPTSAGQKYYCSDCATDGEVISTGTTMGAFARVSARTTTIQ